MATAASSSALLNSTTIKSPSLSINTTATARTKISHFSKSPQWVNITVSKSAKRKCLRVVNSVSISSPQVKSSGPDDLVQSILSMVAQTDGGLSLTKEGHKDVADVAQQLQKYCVSQPVKCPLIFGDWEVAYCSRPTSPGGGYRSVIGRLFFKTKEMVQAIEAPDIVRNKVSFTALGFLDGEVSLKGKLKPLDDEWVQVIFEPPVLKVGAAEFQYGFESEVKLKITYVDQKIRLGKGSKGSLFVFQRRY